MERTWPVRGGPKRPVAERFWEKVEKTDGCWLWRGATNSRGYGVIQIAGKTRFAHRISLDLAGRALEPGELACHRCDNPPCVRPDHLFAGSVSDNAVDAVRKGKWPRTPLAGARGEALRIAHRRWLTEHPEQHKETRKTHCAQGHPYSPENTYRPRSGKRVCRTCSLARSARDRARRRAAKLGGALSR